MSVQSADSKIEIFEHRYGLGPEICVRRQAESLQMEEKQLQMAKAHSPKIQTM